MRRLAVATLTTCAFAGVAAIVPIAAEAAPTTVLSFEAERVTRGVAVFRVGGVPTNRIDGARLVSRAGSRHLTRSLRIDWVQRRLRTGSLTVTLSRRERRAIGRGHTVGVPCAHARAAPAPARGQDEHVVRLLRYDARLPCRGRRPIWRKAERTSRCSSFSVAPRARGRRR